MRKLFTKLDTDFNGFLSLEELESGMREMSQIFRLEEPDVREMFRAADANGDGKIDYTEFIAAAYEKDLLLSSQNLRNTFNMFDSDGNGFISKEELKLVFGAGNVS